MREHQHHPGGDQAPSSLGWRSTKAGPAGGQNPVGGSGCGPVFGEPRAAPGG